MQIPSLTPPIGAIDNASVACASRPPQLLPAVCLHSSLLFQAWRTVAFTRLHQLLNRRGLLLDRVGSVLLIPWFSCAFIEFMWIASLVDDCCLPFHLLFRAGVEETMLRNVASGWSLFDTMHMLRGLLRKPSVWSTGYSCY